MTEQILIEVPIWSPAHADAYNDEKINELVILTNRLLP